MVVNVGRSEITLPGLLLIVPDVSTACAVVIFRARVELCQLTVLIRKVTWLVNFDYNNKQLLNFILFCINHEMFAAKLLEFSNPCNKFKFKMK